jgi:L-arabinose transport system permease protein
MERIQDKLKMALDNAGMLMVFIILFSALSIFVPNFFSLINMKGLALSVSMVGMVSCTMLFCLASGHFDLSIEAIVAASGVLCAVVINSTGSIFLGIIAGLAGGAFVGFINGVIIAKFKINALITTLATMQIVRGLGYIISGGQAVGIKEPAFYALGNAAFLGIPAPVWITVACFALFGFILNKTVFGRNTLAIGGNEEASRLAGIDVDKEKIIIFTIQGLVAASAGIILASRMTSGQPMTSQGFALEVIAACVLGGISLTGGIGTMTGVIVGVLIMGTVQNAMNLLNIPAFYQYVARGLILLGAVLFDRFKQVKGVR